jgi:hypothetical protein
MLQRRKKRGQIKKIYRKKIKKTLKTKRPLKSQRLRKTVKKGKPGSGFTKKRLRGKRGKGIKKKFRTGYKHGYREGHARGFEDARQDSYNNGDAGSLNDAQQVLSAEEMMSIAGARIGVLYICTGKYNVFWDDFYSSAENYLLPGYSKTYFVFTDAAYIAGEENENVRRIYQDNLGWPGNSLMRFAMFNSIQQTLLDECDFVFFFNSNMKFEDTVNEEIIPVHEGLVALNHYGFYQAHPDTFPYDRNPDCLANIPFGHGKYYFAGALMGGRTSAFLELSQILSQTIYTDLERNIQALWFDESYYNQHLLDKFPKVLSPSYGYPEGWYLPFPLKILLRDKNKWGGYDVLRN